MRNGKKGKYAKKRGIELHESLAMRERVVRTLTNIEAEGVQRVQELNLANFYTQIKHLHATGSVGELEVQGFVGNTYMYGRIDSLIRRAAEGDFRLIDYKTHSQTNIPKYNIPTMTRKTNYEHHLQVNIYALLLHKTLSEPKNLLPKKIDLSKPVNRVVADILSLPKNCTIGNLLIMTKQICNEWLHNYKVLLTICHFNQHDATPGVDEIPAICDDFPYNKDWLLCQNGFEGKNWIRPRKRNKSYAR